MLKSKLKHVCLLMSILLATGILCSCNNAKPVSSDQDEYAPVSSLTMTNTEAAALAGKMHFRIYYANAAGTKLAWETKMTDYVKEFRRPDALAKAMLEQMLLAPQNSNLQKTMPEGTKIQSVVVAGNVATVDLNAAFYESLSANPKTAPLVMAALVTTLTELKEVSCVSFLCDGKTPTVSNSNLSFNKVTRNAAVISASLEITTLSQIAEAVIEAGIAQEEPPVLE